ncbi:chitinase [Glaciihabitans sp. dw_435]|uniref:chitinase n=1 Tax=Glaciihabitans sp. dw_435 TaxID=2720081 RepID=UPI001BD347C7|nr:chitinase [Glaciihabitans sp. dw_435]
MSELAIPVHHPDKPPARGRRLSPLRVALALFIVVILTAGAYTGYQVWNSNRAVASYDPWFAGYVDVTSTPSYAFENPSIASQKNVVLSFVVAATDDDCAPSWGTFYSLDSAADGLDLDRRIARLTTLGGAATISFGGAINNELATVCTDPDELVAAYASVVDRYKSSTIDLDIEGDDLTNTAAGDRRALAIKTLQDKRTSDGAKLKVWLTLPVSPTGLTADGTTAVAQMLAAGVDLAGVNAMTMDFGGSKAASDSMSVASIAALNATHDQLATLYTTAKQPLTSAELWSRIGATPMIGQNDVPGEIFDLKDATALNTFAQQKQLGRMSMWSMNRDLACGPNFVAVGTVSNSCSGVAQGGTFFSDALSTRFSTTTPTPVMPLATTIPTKGAAPAESQIVDNPITSPYVVWAPTTVFQKDTKVVWHGNVFQAKWWTRGELPDDPAALGTTTPWVLIGPVLPTDKPRVQIILPVGTYPEWDPTKIYGENDRIMLGKVPYENQWWSQGDNPEASLVSPDSGPWRLLTSDEVTAVKDGSYARPTATPTPTPAPASAG